MARLGAINLQPGMANRTKTFIQVRWRCFALPFTLTTLSTAVLVLAIVLTECSDTPAGGSSSLALLFHSLQVYDSGGWVPCQAGELEPMVMTMRETVSKDEWPPAFIEEDWSVNGAVLTSPQMQVGESKTIGYTKAAGTCKVCRTFEE